MIIEVAVDEYSHAKRAEELGADRIELCANLYEGGTTPSGGLILQCVRRLQIPVHVMVRCRPGDFTYSQEEIELMISDIRLASELGAAGIVFGCLSIDRSLDHSAIAQIMNVVKEVNLHAVFHRAIDVCSDYDAAIDYLIEQEVDCILTSGQSKTAIEGIDVIQNLMERVDGAIQVMAGSGVNPLNVKKLRETGIDALHFTCRKPTCQEFDDPFSFGKPWTFNDEKFLSIIQSFEVNG